MTPDELFEAYFKAGDYQYGADERANAKAWFMLRAVAVLARQRDLTVQQAKFEAHLESIDPGGYTFSKDFRGRYISSIVAKRWHMWWAALS